MPVPDNLLPTQGLTPWGAKMQTAWDTMRAFVNGLETSKAATSHSHTTGQVTGLDAALTGKAPTVHSHTVNQISDSSAIGRTVLTSTDAAAVRTAIGASAGDGVILLPNFAAFPTPQNAVPGAVYGAIQD